MTNIYKREIIEVEKRLGFLYISAMLRPKLPLQPDGTVPVHYGKTCARLHYNPVYSRIFGLTEFYKEAKIKAGDSLSFHVDTKGLYLHKSGTTAPENDTAGDEFDLSGLDSCAKGNIAEDRIKEYLLLYGLGLLNVYKPVIDKDGIDLIVLQSGIFHPLYLQVKSRYNVSDNGQIILTISDKTFQAHHSLYLIGVSFDKRTLEIDDRILFIPSHEIEKNAIRLSNGNLRIVACLKDSSRNRWSKFILPKTQLARKIIEEISKMDQYLK